jgi:transcriptional regulator with XRE-family HTH domain
MEHLIRLRKLNKLTQAELGEKINIDGNAISRYKRGIIKPSIEVLRKLATFFNTPVDELLNGPQKNELKIEFVWEVSDTDILKLESNSFGFGFRGSEVLLWEAMPDEEDEEAVAREIAKQIRIARIGKAAMEKARKE